MLALVDEQRAAERDDDRPLLVEARRLDLDDPDLRPRARLAARQHLGLRVERVALEDRRGQANLVSAQLGDLEFSEARPPTNDSRYPKGDLDCVGQLRFGPAGEPAASTLALVLPCVELVRDDRSGPGVDVVVGAAFTDVSPGRAARDVLDQLSAPAGENGRPAAANPQLLAQARETGC